MELQEIGNGTFAARKTASTLKKACYGEFIADIEAAQAHDKEGPHT